MTLAERFWEKVNKNGPTQPHMDTPCWEWKAQRDKAGYGHFRADEQRRCARAHRIAWEIVNGPIPPGMSVLHRCDYPPCVRAEDGEGGHLFLGTRADNMDDMVSKGRQAKGERSGARRHPEKISRGEKRWNTSLTDEMVVEIRRRGAAGEMWCDIAKSLGVDKTAVALAGCGRTWAHLPGAIRRSNVRASGERNGAAKLTAANVLEARARRAQGETWSSLGRSFGVHWSTVQGAVRGKTWRHCQG